MRESRGLEIFGNFDIQREMVAVALENIACLISSTSIFH